MIKIKSEVTREKTKVFNQGRKVAIKGTLDFNTIPEKVIKNYNLSRGQITPFTNLLII